MTPRLRIHSILGSPKKFIFAFGKYPLRGAIRGNLKIPLNSTFIVVVVVGPSQDVCRAQKDNLHSFPRDVLDGLR